jgi:hypothetical protein
MTKLIAMLLLASPFALAHDEGHGPKVSDTPKQGGVLASVTDTTGHSSGYKAELVRSDDMQAKVYVYDKAMNTANLGAIDKTANGVLEVKKKSKSAKTPFTLNLTGDAFVGTLPKAAAKPYDVEVSFNSQGKKLRAIFENLD